MGAILVTGGAGYIVSHRVRPLGHSGRRPLLLDSLAEGHRPAVAGSPLEVYALSDRTALAGILARHEVEWIIHMAASCLVGESMTEPRKYWNNNVATSLILLEEAQR